MSDDDRLTIARYLGRDDIAAALRSDARDGLTSRPKELPPKWFYDARGSELFDEITRVAEYYPTEAERQALYRSAEDIVGLSGADTVMELGSGSSDKTRVLLDAFDAAGSLRRYVPFDVSGTALESAARRLLDRYPSIAISGVIGDFDRHLEHLPAGDARGGRGHRLLAFLGGTIGNYPPQQRKQLLATMAEVLDQGETLLLGTDLVKEPTRIVSAYDDASGVTAAFNRNVLAVLNRELGADFDTDGFDHVALWNASEEWIEMRLRARAAHTVRIPTLDLTVEFDAGEEILTEVSAKFRRERIVSELDAAGFELIGWFTDPAGDFALSLSRRV